EYGRCVDGGDHSNIASNQIGSQARQLVIVSIGPPVFNRYVTAFIITASAETLMECRHKVFRCAGRCLIEVANHRHRRLLRARRERPCRRAAEERDELTASHCSMPPVLPSERIAHLRYGRRLLRCGISIRLVTFCVSLSLASAKRRAPVSRRP